MAPSSPRMSTWNRRIVSWGCSPVFVAGLIGGLVTSFQPEMTQVVTVVGTGLLLIVGVPVTVFAFWLRWDNQRRYRRAEEKAAAKGKRVRVVETESGDHEYVLEDIEEVEPLDWDD